MKLSPKGSGDHSQGVPLYPRGASTVSGGATPFSPANVSGLVRWYKASSLSLNDNDPVASWTDLAGNFNATQDTAGFRPIFKTNIVNGKAIVRFDGTDDRLNLGDLSALTQGEIFVVIRIDVDPPLADPQTGIGTFGTFGASSADHYPYTDGNIYMGWGSDARKTVGNPVPSLSAAFRIVDIWSAPSDWAFQLDNASIFSTVTNTVGFNSNCLLGMSDGPTDDYFLDGDVAELIVYNNKISTPNRNAILAYFDSEY